MSYSFFTNVLDGHFHTKLLSLELTNELGVKCQGNGSLTWNENEGMKIDGVTDGGESLWDQFGLNPEPGKVIPHTFYLKLRAQTENGWDVEIDRIHREDFDSIAGHPTVFWRIRQSTICSTPRFRSTGEPAVGGASSRLVLSPDVLRFWPRGTTTTSDNPVFGWKHQTRDWLQFDTTFGTVSAHSRGNDKMLIRIDGHLDDPDTHLGAVRGAFGFVSGLQVYNMASGNFDGKVSTRLLYRVVAKRRTVGLLSPLGPYASQNPERMLAKASEFFATERGNLFANYFFACVDSASRSFTTHALVVSAALEGMIGELASMKKTNTTPDRVTREWILKHLQVFLLDESVVKRFAGFMDNMDKVRVVDKLRKWADENCFGVTEDHVRSFDYIRNRVAHGKLLMVEGTDVQEKVDHLNKLIDLVYRLNFQAAGYDGEYFDYTKNKFDQFPLADLTML